MDESWLLGLFKNAPFFASFLAGILTFLSPCILPLLPAYFSYISGLSIEEIKKNNSSNLLKITLNCLIFVLGFSFVFILLGLFLDTVLGSLFNHAITRYIAGGIICLFGLHFMGILKWNFLYQTKRFDFGKNSLFSPFLLGMSFSLGWSPCVGPILASIFSLSIAQKDYSLALICIYCLGLALPFLLVSLFIGTGLGILKKLSSYLHIIEIISGVLLILIGLGIAFDGITLITNFIQS